MSSGTRRSALLSLVVALAYPTAAHAFKPYTHNFAGREVLRSIDFDARKVLIDGTWYPLRPEVSDAIKACPECFYAGTIGPDGFPDLTFGQAVIHPVKTGKWLRQILGSAWAAQSQGYSPEDKQKILAFSYGYLTHAAGDYWGHTLVNELSHGVFPGIEEVEKQPADIGIAIRHIIVEGVIGDATPGYDGNTELEDGRDWAVTDYRFALDGIGGRSFDPNSVPREISTRSTPGFPYEAPPAGWVYDALIREDVLSDEISKPTYNPDADVPRAQRGQYIKARGPLIGGFLELRDALKDQMDDPLPDPLEAAINEYDDTLADLNNLGEACDFDDWSDLWDCPAALLDLGIDAAVDSAEALAAVIWTATVDLALMVFDAYLGAWVADIDDGLRHWNELGLATSRALFDTQTVRELQDEKCKLYTGDESLSPATATARDTCKAGVGMVSMIWENSEDFINGHGLSMVGLPDFVGDLREIFGDISDTVEDVLVALDLPYNPILDAKAALDQWVSDLINDAISDALGVDVEELDTFMKHPSRYMCLQTAQFTLPYLGDTTVGLFANNEQQRLEDYLGLGPDAHEQQETLDLMCGPLKEDAEFDPEAVRAFRNTAQMGRLLLLDGAALNQLLTNELGRDISTYAADGNVMVDAHTSTGQASDTDPYLWLIDGDHAWRADGQPVFDTNPSAVRPEQKRGGSGHMPIWESCVLRPAFSKLFKSWESPWVNGRGPAQADAIDDFPEFGDAVSADPVNDPQPPQSTLTPGGKYLTVGPDSYYVGPSHTFTLTAHDGPVNRAFADADVQRQRVIYTNPLAKPNFVEVPQGDEFSVAGPDGQYYIDYYAADPCHPFSRPSSDMAPEPTHTVSVVLDTTPPNTTCNTPPFGMTFTTADDSAVSYSITDAGAGIKSQSATIDGLVGAAGAVAIVNGAPLDMFLYWPGVRTVAVTSTDNLDNTGTKSCQFEIHATSASLLANLERAAAEGKIDANLYHALRVKLEAAAQSHQRGNHKAEANAVGAFGNQARAQRGKGIEAQLADKLVAYANDLAQRMP